MISMNKRMLLCLGAPLVSLAISGIAEAALLGVQQSYSDITLNQAYLIYDNNAINSTTGLLKVVSFGSTLNEGPAAGNSTLTQSYARGSDHTPDLMLSIAIDRTTGNWVNSNDSAANNVTIGFGNSVIPGGTENTPGFSWTGNITGFGWQQNTSTNPPYQYGTFFDASWKFIQDDYEDMPANMGQFVDNVLTNAMAPFNGGIKISNSAGFGAVAHPTAFQRDWVFGANADKNGIQRLLSPFLTGLSSNICSNNTSTNCATYLHSTVNADVFVPIPPAFWLWAGALSFILPSVRKAKNIDILRDT